MQYLLQGEHIVDAFVSSKKKTSAFSPLPRRGSGVVVDERDEPSIFYLQHEYEGVTTWSAAARTCLLRSSTNANPSRFLSERETCVHQVLSCLEETTNYVCCKTAWKQLHAAVHMRGGWRVVEMFCLILVVYATAP